MGNPRPTLLPLSSGANLLDDFSPNQHCAVELESPHTTGAGGSVRSADRNSLWWHQISGTILNRTKAPTMHGSVLPSVRLAHESLEQSRGCTSRIPTSESRTAAASGRSARLPRGRRAGKGTTCPSRGRDQFRTTGVRGRTSPKFARRGHVAMRRARLNNATRSGCGLRRPALPSTIRTYMCFGLPMVRSSTS